MPRKHSSARFSTANASERPVHAGAARAARLAACCTLLFLTGCVRHHWDLSEQNAVSFSPEDRILILAPHPDDETIGCTSVIRKSLAAKRAVKIVFLTNGDSNEWALFLQRKRPIVTGAAALKMGQMRQGEALAAAEVLGLAEQDVVFLGYPDAGMLKIWTQSWGDNPPIKSRLTKSTAVPYENAYRFGTPHKGEEVLADLKAIIAEYRPTKIFVSHPADIHDDHRALYLFTRVALWDLREECRPEILPYLVHYHRWPRPKGLKADRPLAPSDALDESISWSYVAASDEERDAKILALKSHSSQYRYSSKFLLSFVRLNELFGDLEEVVLSQPRVAAELDADEEDWFSFIPQYLDSDERAAYVGIESESVFIENGGLVITLELSRRIGRRARASAYVFGYRRDTPFNEMPKLHVKLGPLKRSVYDQTALLPAETVSVKRDGRKVTIAVPLEALGMPEKVLTNVWTYIGELPLDSGNWNTVDIGVPQEVTD